MGRSPNFTVFTVFEVIFEHISIGSPVNYVMLCYVYNYPKAGHSLTKNTVHTSIPSVEKMKKREFFQEKLNTKHLGYIHQ